MTRAGVLVPRTESDAPRHPRVEAIEFHSNGQVARVKLAPGSQVVTPLGRVRAELITFHPNGAVRRVFPVAGRLAPEWTEEQERAFAPKLRLETPAGAMEATFISIHFYPTGALRSVTLWPGETLPIRTPIGELRIRQGIAFREDGSIASVEPAEPVPVATPLGELLAFDPDPIGLHADANSLEFDPSGAVAALVTASGALRVRRPDGGLQSVGPAASSTAAEDACCGGAGLRIAFVDKEVRMRFGREEVAAPLGCVAVERGAPARKHLPCVR